MDEVTITKQFNIILFLKLVTLVLEKKSVMVTINYKKTPLKSSFLTLIM